LAASASILQTELSAGHLVGKEEVYQVKWCSDAEYQGGLERVCSQEHLVVYLEWSGVAGVPTMGGDEGREISW
jgi:hypothetical protein